MKKTIGLTVMAALAAATWFCGCSTNQEQKFVIHDTVHDDYRHAGKWASGKTNADQMTYREANRWLEDFRKNERGEYADTGANDYPVKIEAAK